MPKIPTREDLKRIQYQNGEKLKVLKRYAQEELDRHSRAQWCRSKKFLEFVLESEDFYDIPLQPFPEEAIEEIYRLPFMEDRGSLEYDSEAELDYLEERKRFLEGELAKVNVELAKVNVELAKVITKNDVKKVHYQEGPGKASADIGDENIKRARKVLEKYGGITGYRQLPRGQKKPIRDEIEKKCKYKDSRNVYTILNKIK